jgi:hypothetical protein
MAVEAMTQRGAGRRRIQVEYVVETRTQRTGTRVRATGRAEQLNPDGSWGPLVKLGPPALADLVAAVEASGFFDLPEAIPPDDGVGGTVLRWTIELDGRKGGVRATLGRRMPPGLQLLNDEVQRVIGEALDAEAGD